MTQTFIRHMKGVEGEEILGGSMISDPEALNEYQTESIKRLCLAIQFEQSEYLPQHPESIEMLQFKDRILHLLEDAILFLGHVWQVGAMIKIIISRLTHETQKIELLKDIALHLTRGTDEIDKDIRKILKLPPNMPYCKEKPQTSTSIQYNLFRDLQEILNHYFPRETLDVSSPEPVTPATPSSSFISQITSPSTPLTPEPEPEREVTMSEIIFKMISNTLDKATLLKVTDDNLKYDMAYVELMQAVENAMEIPVIEIRKDIVDLYNSAYRAFEYNILAKERIEAEIIWEKRMRKKLKRLVRRQKNFRGYETPPSGSELSSHPSYKKPPPRPCVCHPKWKYNRYPKDRYGIYLATDQIFDDYSITAAPVMADTQSEENPEAKPEVVVK